MIETPNRPYYDDFDVTKGFLKVLFKPGLSVQTRELNQLQSILQNQIGSLADTIYKAGSVVKDGRLSFKNDIAYVKLFSTYNNVNYNYDRCQGRMFYGITTEIVASVFDGFNADNTNPGTLYLNYLSSGVNQEKTFQENEVLQLINEIYVSQVSGTFRANETIVGSNQGVTAKLILAENNKLLVVYDSDGRFTENERITGQDSGASGLYSNGETEVYQIQVQNSENITEPIGVGSFAILASGIYYVDGYFVNVQPQQIILNEYGSSVSAKVGFNKEVKYIEATDDLSLYDNANGTPNENAPGADRLFLNLKLGYYNLYDDVPEQFIEIMRISNSVVIFDTSTDSQWSNILDLMAKRTYDESGNYTVNPFIVDIQEFLDENNNNGIYKEEYFAFGSQVEAQNASVEVFGQQLPGTSHLYNYRYYPLNSHEEFIQACRDRVCLGINPGLAYVFGYEVDLANRIYVPMLKARETGVDYNSLVNVKYGNYVLVNNVQNVPNIYNLQEVILCNQETFNKSNNIGTARVRMMKHHSGTYGDTGEVFRLYLIDIEMNESYNFTNDVKSIGSESDNGFKCKVVLDTAQKANLYDIDKNILVYNLPQNAVESLDLASYEFMYTASGNADATGVITVNAPANSIYYSTDADDYILAVGTQEGATTEIVDTTNKITIGANGTSVQIDLGDDYDSYHYSIIATVHRNDSNLKTKTLVANAETLVASPTSSMTIPHTDGFRLVGVYDSGDKGTPATTGSANVTANYTFDGGQRDNYYGQIKINQIPNTSAPSGQLLIVYDYFTHSSGDYFSAESYEGQVDYAEIPTYTSESGAVYDLRNCLDFRPKIDDSGDGFTSVSNPRIIAPSSNFESNVSYYLPRIDILEVDYLGNFKVKQGTSAINPQTPQGDLNSMVLYSFEIPSYTQNINDIVKNYRENKRFTMRDIGLLETRINAMENYILLTQNDYDISNMPIFGSDGTARYKTGYIADNFIDHSYGEISDSGYKCSIDITSNILRPSYKLNTVVLERNTNETSTAVEQGGKYMIPKTDVNAINQIVGTSIQRVNESGLISWVGNLLISPSVNNIFNNINQSKQNFGDDTDYLNEFNAAIADTDNNLEYGNFFSNWLGVK